MKKWEIPLQEMYGPPKSKMDIIKAIRKNLINIPGWRTDRRIVVVESDDWGSIRIPSKEVYDLLLQNGVPVDSFYFTKYDCLESEKDLTLLFEILGSFKDKNLNYPVITANAVVANPDFKKIAETGKREYHYELITDTYNEYPDHLQVMKLWKEIGIDQKMLWPQYHGREHLNVEYWMHVINSEAFSERLAFENKTLLGISVPGEPEQDRNYMAAFEYNSHEQMIEIEEITADGLRLFNQIFGFVPHSFAPSCSIQGEHIDRILYKGGVLFHQCGQQFRPAGNGKLKTINKFWGQTNSLGQIYWRRNCTFEPSRNHDYDWVDSCLAEMSIAFRWGKPAVISSHRVNYVGSISPGNREKSLKSFKRLLHKALQKWPDIEFMTSEDLGNLILQTRKPT